MARNYQVISCDGHLETPPSEWVHRVPERFQDYVPKLVNLPDGGHGWLVEGQPILNNGRVIYGGRKPMQLRNASYWYEDGTPVPGAGGPTQRLQEQDLDGIDAELLYPSVHISHMVQSVRDRRAYLAIIQGYNDYVADYCSVAPDRLIGAGFIPVADIDTAVAEMKRIKRSGLRCIEMMQFPNGSGYAKPEDDKFWEAALAEGVALTPHLGFGEARPTDIAGTQDLAVHMCLRMHGGPMFMIAQLICSGVFERFPQLRFLLGETNASWLPAGLFMFDDSYDIYHDFFRTTLPMKPSEYVRKHFFWNIIRDPLALKMRDLLPAETLTWASDHPHGVTSFPESRRWLDIIFEGVPEGLKRKILVDNPVDILGLDPNKALTPTPGAAVAAGAR